MHDAVQLPVQCVCGRGGAHGRRGAWPGDLPTGTHWQCHHSHTVTVAAADHTGARGAARATQKFKLPMIQWCVCHSDRDGVSTGVPVKASEVTRESLMAFTDDSRRRRDADEVERGRHAA